MPRVVHDQVYARPDDLPDRCLFAQHEGQRVCGRHADEDDQPHHHAAQYRSRPWPVFHEPYVEEHVGREEDQDARVQAAEQKAPAQISAGVGEEVPDARFFVGRDTSGDPEQSGEGEGKGYQRQGKQQPEDVDHDQRSQVIIGIPEPLPEQTWFPVLHIRRTPYPKADSDCVSGTRTPYPKADSDC